MMAGDPIVRRESLPVPDGHTEKRERRTRNSKTFLKPEKQDGKDVFVCETRMGDVCYQSDTNELRSIDTTIRDLNGTSGVEWAPYRFYVHKKGIGFDFHSRQGGFVKVSLAEIGDENFDQNATYAPTIEDNKVIFSEIRPGCDIIFVCKNQRVKTYRILKDSTAPRRFVWLCEHDETGKEKVSDNLVGVDNSNKNLDLQLEIVQESESIFRCVETWSGFVKTKPDLATRIKSLSADVAWPVVIDPTVSYSVAASANDGRSDGDVDWRDTDSTITLGQYNASYPFNPGMRFTGVAVPNAATITTASLNIDCGVGTNTAAGIIYGWDADSPGNFNVTDLPQFVTKTSASVALPTPPSGANTFEIGTIIQEIVNRAGWVSGNAIAIPIIENSGLYSYTSISAYDHPTRAAPELSITYTSGGGGGGSLAVFYNHYVNQGII